jgi:thioredoxin reductase (NADPH)
MEYLRKEVSGKNNIEVIYDSAIRELKGEQSLQRLIVENLKTKETHTRDVQGLFVAVGVKPATEVFRDCVNLDEGGFIVTDEYLTTSQPFIWACGDCRKRPLRQLITAAAEGAVAALSAYKYLKGGYISV